MSLLSVIVWMLGIAAGLSLAIVIVFVIFALSMNLASKIIGSDEPNKEVKKQIKKGTKCVLRN